MSGDAPSNKAPQNLTDKLDRLTAPTPLCDRRDDGAVQCAACAHRCVIAPGARGVCRMRVNRPGPNGTSALWAPRGYVASVAVDPIEKKPLYHVLPGSEALSFGMLGCNFMCDFCQNWTCSQVLRENALGVRLREISPEALVNLALDAGAPVIASTYNEPLITCEWAHEILTLGREKGMKGAFISNGYATTETLEYMRPVLDIFKADLKSFQPSHYQQIGGRLEPVLESIQTAHRMGYWVEVVTLVIPGFNDSDGELRDMAQFIASVSPDIPWHVTAFHPDYKMTTGDRPTGANDIVRAAQAGMDARLRYVYAGNLRGELAELENTRCPSCRATIIQRTGFAVRSSRITAEGRCPDCALSIAGLWRRDS